MVTKQELIRTKLQNKLFGSALAKTVVLNHKTAGTYNTRGELESGSYTESSIPFIPYNLMDKTQEYQSFGNMNAGECDAAVQYNIDINIDDYIVMESENWFVKNIEKNYLPENVVTIVRLSKEQP